MFRKARAIGGALGIYGELVARRAKQVDEEGPVGGRAFRGFDHPHSQPRLRTRLARIHGVHVGCEECLFRQGSSQRAWRLQQEFRQYL